jgi:hypothetical protein
VVKPPGSALLNPNNGKSGWNRQFAMASLGNGFVLMLAVAAVNQVGLPEGLFLALAMLTVLETDLGGGVIAGRERVTGTILGWLAVVITVGISPALPLPARVFSGLLLVRLFRFTAGLNNGFIVGGHVVAGSLPQLVAEQSLTQSNQDAVLWAQAIETDLLQPQGSEDPSQDSEQLGRFLLASRLLLLADALERLVDSPMGMERHHDWLR